MFMMCGSVKAVMVFSFPSSPTGNLSYTILNSQHDKNMPEVFLICVSHRETHIDGKSFLTILGETKAPWISLSIWQIDEIANLFLKKSKTWYHITELEPHWLNFWIHTSLLVDSIKENIHIELNRDLSFDIDIEKLDKGRPEKFSGHLYLGLSVQDEGVWQQFKGSVANLRIIDMTEVNVKTNENHCSTADEEKDWEIRGLTQELSEDLELAEEISTSYRIIIPAITDLMQGYGLCKKLFGKMSLAKDEKELAFILKMFEKIESPCNSIWTPITDKTIEGEFRDMETGVMVKYLPWDSSEGEPQNSTRKYSVVLSTLTGKYNTFPDVSDDYRQVCTACDLKRNKTFSMIGTCETSYLGKHNFTNLKLFPF